MKWSVYHINDLRNIVICEFEFSPKTIRTYKKTISLEHSIEFDNELYFKEKAKKVEIIKLPPSKQVIIRDEDKKYLYFIFKRNSNKLMYELSEFYRVGTIPGSWEEKYKKLYLVYEELEKNLDFDLKSIRHSLSHTRKSLNDKRTTEVLYSLFGDKKINLKISKHNKVFKSEYERLRNITSELFIKKLNEYIIPSNKIEHFYIS